jgi:hypothetical protein
MQLPGWRICRALHSDRACSADGQTAKNDATDTTTAIFGNSLIENTGITHLSWGERAALCLLLAQSGHRRALN